ncbi:MAG: ABC transporter permease, partial [Nocardioidaceae bacterium]
MTRRREGLRTATLLTPPLLWLGVFYLGALVALFVASFWSINDFTTQVEKVFTFDNYKNLFTVGVYRTVTLRTIGIAILVTLIDAALAIPI